jgi:photosystem II PsbU protein
MAFVTGPALPTARTTAPAALCSKHVRMSASPEKLTRRAALGAALSAAAAAVALPLAASANIEYGNVGFLGGSDKIDVNNANVRAYLKYPGFYPSLAGIIVSNGPYKSTSEIAELPGITPAMKETLSKFKDNLVALEPAPEYQLDTINNGLYR